jgi:hypothetical protein
VQRTIHHVGGRGEVVVPVRREGSFKGNERWLFECPACGSGRSVLVLLGKKWACRICHHLKYRSDIVGASVRRAEKLARLVGELETLQARGARRSQIKWQRARIEAELAKVDRDLPFPEASSELRYLVAAEWVEGEFEEDGFYEVPAYRGDREEAANEEGLGVKTRRVGATNRRRQLSLDAPEVAAALSRLQGERLFAGEALEDFLNDTFKDTSRHILKSAVRERDDPEDLAEYIVNEAKVVPLRVTRTPCDAYVFPNEGPAGGTASAHPRGGENVASMSFRYRGDHSLWGCPPAGLNSIVVRGRIETKMVTLSAAVEENDAGGLVQVFRHGVGALQQILAAQAAVVNAYNESLPERAMGAVEAWREESDVRSGLEERLRRLRF